MVVEPFLKLSLFVLGFMLDFCIHKDREPPLAFLDVPLFWNGRITTIVLFNFFSFCVYFHYINPVYGVPGLIFYNLVISIPTSFYVDTQIAPHAGKYHHLSRSDSELILSLKETTS